MENYKIIRYKEEFKEQLRQYLSNTFPRYSNEYIDICLDSAEDNDDGIGDAFMIINDSGQIVGCHMFYNTKAFVNGQVVNTRWGHDTYINEDCRKDCSIQFIVSINRVPAFGIGVSDANKKIQESIRTRFIEGLYTFVNPNFFISLGGLLMDLRLSKFMAPDTVKIKNTFFERIYDPELINYKNDGFWYKESNNVDFIRDSNFVNQRFVNNKAFLYYIYTSRLYKCYFVVRPIKFHGIPVLFLVDFRYDDAQSQTMSIILKACQKIALKNKLGGIVVMSNDPNVFSFFSKRISLKRQTTLVANKYLKLTGDIRTNVTAADADVDYMYNH